MTITLSGALERCQPITAVRFQHGGFGSGSRGRDDERHDGLEAVVVASADHGGFEHGVVLDERGLDLGR